MAKKSKSSKKKKKGGKKKAVDISQDPNFKMGNGDFLFENGDKYSGSYCAHRSGVVWREGPGTYVTHDGHVYEAFWKDDKMDDSLPVQIYYNNSDIYSGKVAKFKYGGPGAYLFKSGDWFSANFDKNQPKGEAVLMDHRGDLWYGCTEEKDRMLLYREHIFFSELNGEKGKGLPKNPPPPIESTPEETTSVPSMTSSELKERVFARSTKTTIDGSQMFDPNSDWYQDSLRYNEMEPKVMEKIKGGYGLEEEESIWYRNYRQTQNILERRKNKSLPITNELLLRFLGDEYRNSCRPVRVMYARSQDTEELEGEGDMDVECVRQGWEDKNV